jgi:hypothetical protein
MPTSTSFSRSDDRLAPLAAALTSVVLGAGCSSQPEPIRSERTPLVAVCAESVRAVPDGAWICGNPRTVECDAQPGTASPATIYVVREAGCDDIEYTVARGPFALGRTDVVVSERVVDPNGGTTLREACRSELDVVDTIPPSSNSLRTSLWPPNHELHSFTARECARTTDVCDPAPDVRFSSVSSDEPADAEGDGSHAPDVVFDGVSTVSLRAERQGGGNGRVYALAWIATDRSGNGAEGECTVAVPHDASGREAIVDAFAYAVPAPGN